MILKTLDARGPLHGYAIARRIEQISSDQHRAFCLVSRQVASW